MIVVQVKKRELMRPKMMQKKMTLMAMMMRIIMKMTMMTDMTDLLKPCREDFSNWLAKLHVSHQQVHLHL